MYLKNNRITDLFWQFSRGVSTYFILIKSAQSHNFLIGKSQVSGGTGTAGTSSRSRKREQVYFQMLTRAFVISQKCIN